MNLPQNLTELERFIPSCRKCPRLVRALQKIKQEHPDHWCRPVPGFGDPSAKILLVGLAPGRLGGNITGRFFTGDASGDFLFACLRKLGFVKKEDALGPYDFHSLFITAVLRCFPPQNKPLAYELDNCRPYLEQELEFLDKVQVIIALGKIAHDGIVKILNKRNNLPNKTLPFRHGEIHNFDKRPFYLIDSYHVSPQNTYTKKLTPKMFQKILKKAQKLAG